MMTKRDLIIQRLEEIRVSVQRREGALALLSLGSAGVESNRLDDYSDIDFFLIVEAGYKEAFIANLDWLTDISAPGFYFPNTKDGYKFLYQDGVFCEFAVFEPSEMASAVFSKGKLLWHRADFDTTLCEPKTSRTPWQPESVEWAFNEALTCLYVGLGRYARGEKLSGTRFVQSYAVDLILASSSLISGEIPTAADEFQHERRYEAHYPEFAKSLPKMIQGYDHTKDSALEILNFIEHYHPINPTLKSEILKLIYNC